MDRTARAARWRRLVSEQARSGLSLREFAARAGVCANTLAYWKYKRGADLEASEPQIVPVTLVGDPRSVATGITIEIGDARLTLSSGFDAAEVSTLITLLRRPC